MRTPLVLLFGSLLVGCTVGSDGTGGGDDGDTICGDSLKEGNEACDDGNTASGDGCSATCTVEPLPKLDMLADKPTIMTELRTTNMVTVTLVGSGGFGGAVDLAASVVDANDTPVPGWTVALDKTNVTIPVDGTVDAVATLTIPSENRGLTGTLKVQATSGDPKIGTKSTTTTITALNQVSLNVTMNGGQCVYTAVMGQTRVTVGTRIRMVNKGTDNMIFHSGGNVTNGVPHQSTAGTGSPVNAAYENTLLAVTPAFDWYCHSPGPNPNGAVTILPVAAQ